MIIALELTSGNAEGSLKKAEEVMKIVQGWSDKDISNKKELIGSLHSCIGNALIDLGNMDKALKHHQKDLELAKQWWEPEEISQTKWIYIALRLFKSPVIFLMNSKLPEAMSRALDNIGRVYAQMGQYVQAIEL